MHVVPFSLEVLDGDSVDLKVFEETVALVPRLEKRCVSSTRTWSINVGTGLMF
jgi:hypothetical protein